MAITENDSLTPREHMIMETERDEARLAREHAVTMRQLEIQLAREKYQAQIELKRLEARWSTLLRIPTLIIKLPILLIASLSLIVFAVRHKEPPKGVLSLFN